MRGIISIPLLVLAATLFGCESASQEELGEIVYEMPKIPGTEKPYVLPELGGDKGDSEPVQGISRGSR